MTYSVFLATLIIRADEASPPCIALVHHAGIRATPTLRVNGMTFEGALAGTQLGAILDDTTPRGCDQRTTDGSCGEKERTEP